MKEKGRLEITVSATPSLNKLRGRWGMFSWKKKYMKELASYNLLRNTTPWLKEQRKRRVSFTRYGQYILPWDKYIGGCRPLLECLAHYGLIIDNNDYWAEIHHRAQVRCSKLDTKTIILIEEM